MVTGLATGNTVELLNNDGDDLLVDINGLVTFVTPLFVGAAYTVSVAVQQTSPNQTCVVNQDIVPLTQLTAGLMNKKQF